jgi:HPt (histidine-containing phosphotransfer) domain-containing protein
MDDAFRSIVLRFRQRCSVDLVQLRATSTEPARIADPAFHVMIHRLSGMAGSVGFGELSRAAADVDDALAGNGVPERAQLSRLEACLSDVAAQHEE